ncbi:hypothetical protein L915_05028, partial [Phytophthora nicotianae]
RLWEVGSRYSLGVHWTICGTLKQRISDELESTSNISCCIDYKGGRALRQQQNQLWKPTMLAFVVDDGYLGFRARVRRCVDKLKEIEWSETGPILLKPTNSASQAKFAPLAESDEELAVQLASTWNLTAKRKNGYAAFALMVN